MLDQFKQRSYELEHIDTGNYTADEYEGCIIELQRVNRWLGDAKTLRDTLLADVSEKNLRSFSVLDVGAGSGELLRVVSSWARETRRDFHGVGLELNARSVQAIIEKSTSDIDAVRGDALHLSFADNAFDYVICSLFTHHFVEQSIVQILREMSRVARRKVFVIDLHRHPIAYLLYTTVGKLFLHSRLVREDGALSILRGFKPDELVELGRQAGLTNVSVSNHFPFRLALSASGQRQSYQSAPDVRIHHAA
jgi:ubiquinone/menaquinone biosynthesis C-methylase UbiE